MFSILKSVLLITTLTLPFAAFAKEAISPEECQHLSAVYADLNQKAASNYKYEMAKYEQDLVTYKKKYTPYIYLIEQSAGVFAPRALNIIQNLIKQLNNQDLALLEMLDTSKIEFNSALNKYWAQRSNEITEHLNKHFVIDAKKIKLKVALYTEQLPNNALAFAFELSFFDKFEPTITIRNIRPASLATFTLDELARSYSIAMYERNVTTVLNEENDDYTNIAKKIKPVRPTKPDEYILPAACANN